MKRAKEIVKKASVILTIIAVISGVSLADEYYVICTPTGEVNVRFLPKKSEIVGCVSFGKKLQSDGKKRNGYIHVEDLAAEVTSGWVYAGYLVEDEPISCEITANIVSQGRVACRKCADGKIIKWLQNGSEVIVYAISEEWCVTSFGFIQTQFIEIPQPKNGG